MRCVLFVLALAACGGPQPSGPAQSSADVDGDGVPDVRDRCAYVAGSEELDGCAAPKDGKDRDRDGIPDAEDNCPDEPEDMDGRDDRDGCPEADPASPPAAPAPAPAAAAAGDRDGDGVVDAKDQCPDDPEDVDSFQDTDGCPDPDNDQDGIRDADDRCPSDPEDKDGFEDADGCPDPDRPKP